MKLKLVKFPIMASDGDLTLGKVYECKEPYPHSDHYVVIDDAGDGHEVEKECFESVVEWSGEGSPRVGQHCKVYVSNADHLADAEVLAVDHNIIVVKYKTPSGSYKYSGFNIRDVRPIKSEKDKEIDNMVEVMIDHFENPKGGEKFKMLAESFYNAGYRKTK